MKLKRSPKGIGDIRKASQVRDIKSQCTGSLSSHLRTQQRIRQLDQAPKGSFGGPCNITACQRPPARIFMEGMNAYYCVSCARDMIEWDNQLVARGEQDWVRFPQGLKEDAVDRRR